MGFKTITSVELPSAETSKATFKSIFDIGSDVVETVGGAVSSGMDKMQGLGEKALEGVKIASSTPVRTMLKDILVPNFLVGDITESSFSPESLDILKQAAIDKGIKPGQRVKLDYEDYNKYGAKLSARFVSGTNKDTRDLKDKLINITPADEVKMTLGEVMVEADADGNLVTVDQYDFNNWAYYGKGKQKNGKYLSYSADEFEKSGLTFFEALNDTIKNSPSDYQMVRNLAFLFGSRDYEGTERDTGRQVRLQLGKLGA